MQENSIVQVTGCEDAWYLLHFICMFKWVLLSEKYEQYCGLKAYRLTAPSTPQQQDVDDKVYQI